MILLLVFILGVAGFDGLSTSFINLAGRTMKLYWKSPQGESKLIAIIEAGTETSLTSYVGHVFYWSEANAEPPTPADEDALFIIESGTYQYIYDDDTGDPEVLGHYDERFEFMEEYYKRTGRRWFAVYPREPVKFFMWPADYVGQTHTVELSDEARQHTCDPIKPECHSPVTNLTIKVIATSPRAFVIENFLTDYESDWVVNQARPHMRRSQTVNEQDDLKVRTSSSWWLIRAPGNHMAETLYRRIADVVRVPHELLWPEKNAESLNVLNYKKTQEYAPHYDWWAQGSVEMRFISLLLYFSTPTKGGATSFPLVHNPDGTMVKTAAVKNQCMFFYDLLPDGNADEFTLHAGEPVEEGEKWVGPLWIWEPRAQDGSMPDEVLRSVDYNKETGYMRTSAKQKSHTEL